MKQKIIRFTVIAVSGALLAASVGVIVWITQDEHSRLADRERAAIEAAERASRGQSDSANGATDREDAEKIFHDIDTLISGLSMDDLPTED